MFQFDAHQVDTGIGRLISSGKFEIATDPVTYFCFYAPKILELEGRTIPGSKFILQQINVDKAKSNLLEECTRFFFFHITL
jgi:hypothetical protein